jgi:Asp-tRNA(Asn)/Glu-tRNA(Gln) amidotransferase C subunit
MNEKEILAQAKKIMDDFVKVLDKVKVEEKFGSERKAQVRVPSEKCTDSSEFRQKVFKNAPKIKDDLFIMEKKQW